MKMPWTVATGRHEVRLGDRHLLSLEMLVSNEDAAVQVLRITPGADAADILPQDAAFIEMKIAKGGTVLSTAAVAEDGTVLDYGSGLAPGINPADLNDQGENRVPNLILPEDRPAVEPPVPAQPFDSQQPGAPPVGGDALAATTGGAGQGFATPVKPPANDPSDPTQRDNAVGNVNTTASMRSSHNEDRASGAPVPPDQAGIPPGDKPRPIDAAPAE